MNRDDFIIKRVKLLLEKEKKGILLDIGPGKGRLTDELNNLGFKIEVCDYDINIIKKLSKYKGKTCDLNNEKLPYPDNSFDYVNCTEVLEHIENPWRVIRDIRRVLKKNGIVTFSTPHVDSIIQKIKYLFTDNLFSFPKSPILGGHITPVHDFVLENILRRNGFEVTTKTYNLGWIPLIRVKLKPSKAFGDTLIIKARKIN